ncbi:general stress protein, partial [Bacillus sp. JJ722]|uniref:general stress protein n=1 Tax=Bacillus sp. JJ722 TaxID=3122973 RepID=UPI003000983F
MKRRIEKRLVYLYTGEFVSIISLIFVSYLLNITFSSLQLYSLYSFWVSFFLLEFLLLQGTIYWYTKLKRLRIENTSITPMHIVRQLQHINKLNMVLIIISNIMFAIDFVKWYPSLPLGGLLIAGFVYIFAVL